MKLNKLTTALGFAVTIAASSSASAFTLQGGDFFLKYNNWETVTGDLAGFQFNPLGTLAAATPSNGTTDLKGIAHITSVSTDAITPAYWNSGDDGEYLWAVFTGLDYAGQDAFGNLSYTGGTFDVYSLSTQLDPFANDGLASTADADVGKWIGDTGFTGITDVGTLLFSFDMDPNLPRISLAAAPAGTTLTTSFNGLGGDGNFYASVNGAGLLDDQIDTNGKLGGSDVFSNNNWELSYDLDGNGIHDGTQAPCAAPGAGCTTFAGGWDIISHDPLTGMAVPAPGVLALMGLGLVGLGFTGRRNKKS